MMESSVLLPPPLGPTSATTAPRATTRLRSASAVTVPPVRPRPAGKRIVTPRTSSSGAPAPAVRAASGAAVSCVAIRQLSPSRRPWRSLQTPRGRPHMPASPCNPRVIHEHLLPALALPRSGSVGRWRWYGHPLSPAPRAPVAARKYEVVTLCWDKAPQLLGRVLSRRGESQPDPPGPGGHACPRMGNG